MNIREKEGYAAVFLATTIVVALSMIGVITSKTGVTSQSAKHNERALTKAALKSHLYQNVSCSDTFNPALGFGPQGNPCATQKYVTLRSKTGILVNEDGSTLVDGRWTVMAYCSPSGLDVRAAWLRPEYIKDMDSKLFKSLVFTAGGGQDRFEQDPLTKNTYHWNAKPSRISSPDSSGLCSHWFAPPPSKCGGYLSNAVVNEGNQDCSQTPSCAPPGNMVFDSQQNKYICSNVVSQNLLSEIVTTTNSEYSQIVSSYSNYIQYSSVPGLNAVNDIINSSANLSDFKDVQHNNSFKECATLSLMRCPDGYAMHGYEALMPTAGDHCRVRCVKVFN
jgi:hypothetical protein